MKDKIRAVNAAMDAGNSLFLNYGAATRRVKNRLTGNFTSKYNSGIRISQREVLPYSFYLSKADNPVIKAIDISKIRGALDKLTAPDGGVAAGLWDNVDGFMSDLAAYFTNLDAGEGARRSAEIFGLEKAKFLGDFVNEQEKGGRKFVRDFRLDRIGSTAPMDFRARISEDAIQKSKMRWMPAETVGDKSVINSEEGYRIISGAKHRLYGPDGNLIGIYDTQTQAERKADATQTRLQPEVRQQQYPARDEVRQTAEAGGRNRNVGRTQGREEGRQELGAVRQAGDVRFMPEGKSAGLAVLDNELALNLPKRPKVLDIANAFQDLFGKAIEYRKSSPQENARLANALVQEIQRAVELHPEAKGWYDENIKLTMDVMRDLDPDLAKPENDFMFKVILAATSDGNKVGPQFQQTWKEYSNWKNTGKISGDFVSGDRIENIKGNLKMFNEMVNTIGWEKTKDFFTRKGTVKEVRQALMDTFGWTKKEAQGVGSSELADEVVPFAVVLGPKLGSFFNNLYGDFSSVTMDRWFMRTIGRLTGTQVEPLAGSKVREMRNKLRDAVARLTPSEFEMLGVKRGDLKGTSIDGAATTISGRFAKKSLRDTAKQSAEAGQSALEETRKFANALKKGLNPLVEAPVDGTHRRWIRERIAEVQKDLRSRGIELENADLQAVLWYLEKELYEKLNYRSKSGESDYASAASSLYQDVVGRPSDVYARGTGRVRAIGGDGRGNVLDTANGGQAPRQEVGAQRFMPSDTDYLSAVQQGDTQAAQRMVDEAAKAAGYTVGPVWHGTRGNLFTVFDKSRIGTQTAMPYDAPKGFYFSKDQKLAERYGPNKIRAFVKGPFLLDNSKIAVVESSGQIKSADPITRDDAGNVIPLSQRFKATSEDIRFMPDYSGEHRAPQRDSGAPLDNLKDVYPDDVYGPNAARYYGVASGDATDKAAIRIIQATKGKPDAPVKVFRAIPKGIQSNEINPGDWITTMKSYAVMHGEGALGGDYKILEKTVPAGDLYTNGDSIFEFGYDPKFMPSQDSAMPGAYSFQGGFRAIPGKAKGSFRLYGPAGSLIGIASSLDEAQRILRRKNK
jgi:plasmid stabilization system protein ParE